METEVNNLWLHWSWWFVRFYYMGYYMTSDIKCSKKHWKKLGKKTYVCPKCDEVLTLGVSSLCR
jgi:hypothetical protein